MAKKDLVVSLRKTIETKLAESFSDLKELVGEKKFSKKVKKAGKILAAGAAVKPKVVKPKAVKPKVVKPKKEKAVETAG